MTVAEAARLLRNMYYNAPEGEMVTNLLLFGIKYADEIHSLSLRQLVDYAAMPASYTLQIRHGINLSKYVELKTG
jgi:hypothetical protein